MKPFAGKIGILGAGALDGYYGARLAQVGGDMHFPMHRDALTRKPVDVKCKKI